MFIIKILHLIKIKYYFFVIIIFSFYSLKEMNLLNLYFVFKDLH
jgi:hypothetical protein